MRAALIKELAAGVAALGQRDALTVADMATVGVIIWKIRRDPNGMPRCLYWRPVPWLSLDDNGALDVPKLRQVAVPRNHSNVVLVCSSAEGSRAARAYATLKSDLPMAPAFICADSLEELLSQVLAHDRLTQFYELVVLRRSKSGRPELAGWQLFPQGARRGDTCQFTIRCEASDEQGTAFAVVAVASGRQFRLVSVKSVKLAPGGYTLTAELRQPGQVRFKGLREEFREDHRSWPELVASLPARLDLAPAAHLICMVEASGTDDQVDDRLGRVEQLIQGMPSGPHAGQTVSLISYGPHSVERAVPEEPLQILTWAQNGKEALAEVDRLRERGAADIGYSRAAQVECVLTEVANRLTGREGRPVLVTVGSRPAFPPRRDPASEIIPCPARRDWRKALQRLRQYPGITFGAIRDHGTDDDIWKQLGSGALARVDAMDAQSFAARLGLLSSAAEHVPFPLLESEGG